MRRDRDAYTKEWTPDTSGGNVERRIFGANGRHPGRTGEDSRDPLSARESGLSRKAISYTGHGAATFAGIRNIGGALAQPAACVRCVPSSARTGSGKHSEDQDTGEGKLMERLYEVASLRLVDFFRNSPLARAVGDGSVKIERSPDMGRNIDL